MEELIFISLLSWVLQVFEWVFLFIGEEVGTLKNDPQWRRVKKWWPAACKSMEEAVQGVLHYLGGAGSGVVLVLWTRVLPQSIATDKWADKKFRQDLLTRASAATRGARIKQQGPLLAHSLGAVGVNCSLYGVRVGVCPAVRLEEWLRWFIELLGVVECRGHALNFCSWLFRSGFFFFFFLSFCIFCPEFAPTAHACSYV